MYRTHGQNPLRLSHIMDTSPQLLDVLRSRQAQAQALGGAYAAAVAAPDAMLYWLARAAKQSREAAGRKQVHVAAEADKDQSSIYRFESAGGWARGTERPPRPPPRPPRSP